MSDVICYGSLIPDRVLRLPRFPQPGEGLHALSETLYLGGEPCNVGGHLAAWDVPVAIAGNNLGSDPLGAFVRAQLARRPRTTVIARDDPQIQTPTCYIWTTPDGERTIIPSWPATISWSIPDETIVRAARMVSASIYGPGMEEMLALARRWQIPLAVADIAGPADARLAGAVLVTTSRTVLLRRHSVTDVDTWIEATHAASGALVVVSDGASTVLALTADGRWLKAEPPHITPVDTTGAGDALKAGLILGWLRDWPIETALRWGIAAASLQCLRHGPCEQTASAAEIEHVMPTVKVYHADTAGRSRMA
jgi:ribokinase